MNTRNTKRRFDSDSDSDYEPPLKVSKNEIKKDNDKDDDKDGIFWIYELDLGDDILNSTHKVMRHLIGTSIEIPDNKILVISNLCIDSDSDNSKYSYINISMIRNEDDYPIKIVSGIPNYLNNNLNIRLCSKTKKLLFQAEGNLFNQVTLTGYLIDV
jgi:hypothetical protein